jgi:hypothetical protein
MSFFMCQIQVVSSLKIVENLEANFISVVKCFKMDHTFCDKEIPSVNDFFSCARVSSEFQLVSCTRQLKSFTFLLPSILIGLSYCALVTFLIS